MPPRELKAVGEDLNLAGLIRAVLEARGWSYADLEKAGGPPKSTLNALLRAGDRARNLPDVATIEALAVAMGVGRDVVVRAGLRSIGLGLADGGLGHWQEVVVKAMGALDAEAQMMVAEHVQALARLIPPSATVVKIPRSRS